MSRKTAATGWMPSVTTVAVPARGMRIGRIRLVSVTAITGSPTISIGNAVSDTRFVNAAAAATTSVAAATVRPFIANDGDHTNQDWITVTIGGTGTGKVLVVVEGLERL